MKFAASGTDAKKDKNKLGDARRQLLIRKLRFEEVVRVEDYKAENHLAPNVVQEDLEQIQRVLPELHIENRLHNGSMADCFVFDPYSFRHRREQHVAEKTRIARFIVGLLWGPDARETIVGGKQADLRNVCSQNGVKGALSTGLAAHATTRAKIFDFLKDYWKSPHRSVFIDAGTTTWHALQLMSRLPLPDFDNNVRRLDIFTNSSQALPLNFDKATSRCITYTIVGGRLDRDTDAITGDLTRRCLESWGMNVDVAVIGTSNIDNDKFELSCNSEDEALTKSWVLSRAKLRCIVADASKITRLHAPFTFATLFST